MISLISEKDNRPASASADEMHQLHTVAVREAGVRQSRPADDLPIELDHHCAGIQLELLEQIRQRRRSGDCAGLSVHRDMHLTHPSSIQGASSSSTALA